MEEKTHDLDLGDGHWLDWAYYEGELCGGIISHTKTEALKAKQRADPNYPDNAVDSPCQGAFTIAGSKWEQMRPGCAKWQMSGTKEVPTLSPSFLCHCGDHGWVRGGRWVRA